MSGGLRRQLLRSHGAVAALGVALLLVATGLLAAEAVAISSLTERSTPALNSITDARSGVRATLAALRGWLATGNEDLKASRVGAWDREVWPSLDKARGLLTGQGHERLGLARRQAADLLEAQWWVEDAAHRPGSRPARLLLEEHVGPGALRLRERTTEAIEIERRLPPDASRRRFLFALADTRGAAAAAYAAVRAAEADPTAEREEEWRARSAALVSALERLDAAAGHVAPEQVDAFEAVQAIAPVFLRQSELVLSTAARGRGSVADRLLATEAVPRADALLATLEGLRQEHLEEQAVAVSRIRRLTRAALGASALLVAIMALVSRWVARSASGPLVQRVGSLGAAVEALARGQRGAAVPVEGDDEVAELARGFVAMRDRLEAAAEAREAELARLTLEADRKSRLADLAEVIRACESPESLAHEVLAFLGRSADAAVGALWLPSADGFELAARHGWTDGQPEPGGQLLTAARDRQARWLEGVAPDHLRVTTGLGESPPTVVAILPLDAGPSAGGVLELGWVAPPSEALRGFLRDASSPAGTALARAAAESASARLLRTTQAQAEELQTQTEELRVTNEELEERTSALTGSEAKLQTQAEELRVSNEELERRQQELEVRNRDIQNASELVRLRADELEEATKVKSEFLANMSHELRTPLNSILILSELLAENPQGNLVEKQIDFARTIHSSGEDLLGLINEVLDLSRVEAGKLELDLEPVDPAALIDDVAAKLRPQADRAGVAFEVHLPAQPLPRLTLDAARIGQVLRNLVGNALKFTTEGRVDIRVSAPQDWLVIAVEDTGPGIPADHHASVFDAFHQVDGTVRRRFGGTGLGLSISRELVQLHGGKISLESTVGVGSTFTLWLPRGAEAPAAPAVEAPAPAAPRAEVPLPEVQAPAVPAGARVLVIVEDDTSFASVLSDLAEEKGFHPVLASDGPTGLALARRLRPSAMIVDLGLPGLGGGELLAQLRADPRTARIPAHVVSAQDRPRELDQLPDVGFLSKPASPDSLRGLLAGLRRQADLSRILVVEDDPVLQEQLLRLFAREGLEVRGARTSEEARAALADERPDCVVLDLGLPDDSGLTLLRQLRDAPGGDSPPVVVYTGRDLSGEELRTLEQEADSVVIKTASSPTRLLEEVRLFLHGVERGRALPGDEAGRLGGRRILLVDDDMRNVYALSELLEDSGAQVTVAADGQEALDALDEDQDIDLVVMDMMMPVMDGYEATRRIRAQPRFADLPVVALTAKAMKRDRIACLEAGASDYLTKPVDVPRLLSVLEVWLGRRA